MRLKNIYGFPKIPLAKEVGDSNNNSFSKRVAQDISRTLSRCGTNLNFAPVVNINVNPNSPAIGRLNRSYSENPEVVVNNAVTFINKHKENQVLTCINHFPGHGSAETDSHNDFVDITETWDDIELIPYKSLIEKDKCEMIMTAHIFNRRIDSLYLQHYQKIQFLY